MSITVKEASDRWDISERRITELCRQGRIGGACKEGKAWFIPDDAYKPEDKRVKSGKYIKKEMERLPLPVGVSDFRSASKEYYYVDKTEMIRTFLDEKPKVSLFTRPRRFGKTLNMDMLRVFFEKSNEDTSIYFRDLKIWKYGEKYTSYQGKYPVIYLSFKDAKQDSWDDTYHHICECIRTEFERHRYVLDGDKLSETEKAYILRVLDGQSDRSDMEMSLRNLSRVLDQYHDIATMIFIDEYDTPIQHGYLKGFYDDVIGFMRNLFSGGLKDNNHLSFGFMTGILRVAKESIFSGLNNIAVNSILDDKYSSYFGFTDAEVRKMAQYYGKMDCYDEIAEWYDGYRFGNTDIFNPWSVISYFRNEARPGAYWKSTGSNEIIGEIIGSADNDTYQKLQRLLSGEEVVSYIDTNVIYPEIRENPSSVFSFLLVAGYLKLVSSELSFSGDMIGTVTLPNREITYVYRKEIIWKLDNILAINDVVKMQELLFFKDGMGLKSLIQDMLLKSVSYFDSAGENFYHGFVLGLCASMEGYAVTSNREAGHGRYDIQLKPVKEGYPGILIEIKNVRSEKDEDLKEAAYGALDQIIEKKYDAQMRMDGVSEIYMIGMAFCGKKVEIAGR